MKVTGEIIIATTPFFAHPAFELPGDGGYRNHRSSVRCTQLGQRLVAYILDVPAAFSALTGTPKRVAQSAKTGNTILNSAADLPVGNSLTNTDIHRVKTPALISYRLNAI